MRFYLVKDKDVELCRADVRIHYPIVGRFAGVGQGVVIAVRSPDMLGKGTLTRKSCQIKENISSLIPMMSEQGNGNGFWNIKTVDKCGSLLMSELIKSSSNCNMLDAVISISTGTSKEKKVTFSVAIEKCNMISDIFNTCGEKAKLILEMFFKMPFTGEPTLAGLVTPEMSITCQKDEIVVKASDFLVTDTMAKFWKKNTSAFGTSIRCFPRIFASCNLLLIVSDDLPLFQIVRSSDTTRRILEEAIHFDFEIITSDNAVVKCHKSFLAVHSPVLERMLECDMTESSSNRMKVEDMDKLVVVAFLQFLYCKELPTDDLSLSLQLLKVAHKYEIDQLEQATMRLLIQKQDLYFTAEFAWEVYVFVRNIPNGNDLKEKVMKIIASEKALLNEEFCQLMRDTGDSSAENELTLWIFEQLEEGIEWKL